jgi:Asp-tRNA(Asn)/Glu-tRNA(Gln) amidotransferase A subunit family amidase
MARTVRDVALLFKVLTGVEASTKDDDRITTLLANPRASLRGWRVACYTEDSVSPVSDDTLTAVHAAARALAEAGLVVENTRPPGIELGHDLWLKLFSRASVIQLRNVYAGQGEKGGEFVRWRLATADDRPMPSLDEYINSWLERDRLRATLIDWMQETPLILAPVGTTPAYPHSTQKVSVGDRVLGTFRAFSYSQTFNVFDLPVAVVPAGRTNEGLPVGVQIIGRPFAEETVLAAAALIEEALGGWVAPPMLSDEHRKL